MLDSRHLRDLARRLGDRCGSSPSSCRAGSAIAGPTGAASGAPTRAVLAHERLAIVDVEHGAQPLRQPRRRVRCWPSTARSTTTARSRPGSRQPYAFATASDCEVILALYRERASSSSNDLNGIFAFVLYDAARERYLIARDPIGVVPLYYGHDDEGHLLVASEMKALRRALPDAARVPAGLLSRQRATVRCGATTSRAGASIERVEGQPVGPRGPGRGALEDAVHRQLMTDVPLRRAALGRSRLVGDRRPGRQALRRPPGRERRPASAPGGRGSTPSRSASRARPIWRRRRSRPRLIGTVHHEFHFTVQEGLDALSDVIYHLETYDVTTIRASTPMYLMARRIRAMGIKMVLSGEGADEIFGGYLYFHKAPERAASSTPRRCASSTSCTSTTACAPTRRWPPGASRRGCRSSTASSSTWRWASTPRDKMVPEDGIEKQVLREAFRGLLPEEILWRQKEQFSDGVGYSWIDSLREIAEREVTDGCSSPRRPSASRSTRRRPRRRYFYRRLFERHFPGDAAAGVRARRQEHRLQHAAGPRLGRELRGERRSVRAGGQRRAPGHQSPGRLARPPWSARPCRRDGSLGIVYLHRVRVFVHSMQEACAAVRVARSRLGRAARRRKWVPEPWPGVRRVSPAARRGSRQPRCTRRRSR